MWFAENLGVLNEKRCKIRVSNELLKIKNLNNDVTYLIIDFI
jgi:hypothetical protein